MIEIIPNWHPVFVHFTIALLSIATLFHVVASLTSKSATYYQFENVANWNLWLGAGFAIVTVIAGWFAASSVDHDTPSHLAMLDHRNWALVTGALFILLAVWSYRRARKALPITWVITLPLLVASGLLGATGWKGGELVYRHGLGVMSLPDKDRHDHASHSHGDNDHNTDRSKDMGQGDISEEAEHEVGEKAHTHDDEQIEDQGNDVVESESTKTGGDAESTQSQDVHDHSDHKH